MLQDTAMLVAQAKLNTRPVTSVVLFVAELARTVEAIRDMHVAQAEADTARRLTEATGQHLHEVVQRWQRAPEVLVAIAERRESRRASGERGHRFGWQPIGLERSDEAMR